MAKRVMTSNAGPITKAGKGGSPKGHPLLMRGYSSLKAKAGENTGKCSFMAQKMSITTSESPEMSLCAACGHECVSRPC